jgi:nitrate reductase gamma subunit
MRELINYIVFGWYPYLCLTVFLLGSVLRFDREQYTWRSGSSQLLRRRQLTWGSNLFHVGILVIFLGHFGLATGGARGRGKAGGSSANGRTSGAV